MNLKKITAKIESSKYQIVIGNNLISNISEFLLELKIDKNILIVHDSFFSGNELKMLISNLKINKFKVDAYSISGGKVNKNFNEVLKIYSILDERNYARDSTIIAFGGGIVGDLAGFVASTWYRGMNLVHIPSTLMGMVDSSVGGKVAINFRDSINSIGNYHHPILNLMDIKYLQSLSDRDFNSGISEVIKYGIISDIKFLNFIKKNRKKIIKRDTKIMIECISKSIKIKLDHVINDVRESNKRLKLNYGHTIGHSIETTTKKSNGEEFFRHGEGVSLGIMASLNISYDRGLIDIDDYESIKELFEFFELPVNMSCKSIKINSNDLAKLCFQNTFKDKKRKDQKLRFILTGPIGKASIVNDIQNSEIRNSIGKLINE